MALHTYALLPKILSQAPPRSTTSRKLYQENKDAQVDKPAYFSFIAEPRIHHISSYKLALLSPKFAPNGYMIINSEKSPKNSKVFPQWTRRHGDMTIHCVRLSGVSELYSIFHI